MKRKVAVLGAGHWGMALASVLAMNDCEVLVWARDEIEVQRINSLHVSKYFPDSVIFSRNISASADIDYCLASVEYVVISTPVSTIKMLMPYISKYKKKYLLTCKGLFEGDVVTNYVLKQDARCQIAILSGPSFSKEIVERKITAVVIAAADKKLAESFQKLFHTSFFRPYTSTDMVGVQLCGAVKNVYAIAAGMVDRVCASDNMKSALLTRALAEMRRLMMACGGNIETLLGLAGIGDLMLTCHSENSRNYMFGYNYSGSVATSETTEGICATKEFCLLAKNYNVEMPIISSIYGIIYLHHDFKSTVNQLLERRLRDEITYEH